MSQADQEGFIGEYFAFTLASDEAPTLLVDDRARWCRSGRPARHTGRAVVTGGS